MDVFEIYLPRVFFRVHIISKCAKPANALKILILILATQIKDNKQILNIESHKQLW